MKKIRFGLLLVPFMLVGCNNSNVNTPKSPFSDSYKPIGMTGKYSITSAMSPENYGNLVKCINNDFKDNQDKSVVNYYSKTEETRDLKAAYFGKNLGAANLCSLTHQVNNNTRYSNDVTTKFNNAHKENQNVSGGINKINSYVNDYLRRNTTPTDTYDEIEQSWIENESVKTKKTISAAAITDSTFELNPFTSDIKTYFGEKSREKSKIIFNVLAEDNKAVYGMSGEKYLIKEAASLFEPYSTTVGDTYKAVNNYFYEALLEKVPGTTDKFRFTDFRYYTELLILSEAISDETSVPIVYLEKPQLVEYSEITYSITYRESKEKCDEFKDPIPEPTL